MQTFCSMVLLMRLLPMLEDEPSRNRIHVFPFCGSDTLQTDLPMVCPIFEKSGLEVIKLEYKLRLKIKRDDWLLADTCPQSANHCALF